MIKSTTVNYVWRSKDMIMELQEQPMKQQNVAKSGLISEKNMKVFMKKQLKNLINSDH